ncbi:MAG: endo alpha-1,4 polygalactosaminidase [Alphaproteobacteria bacterium]|nr:endo alpha-1,4 polygalactosaminidase [Alphaproteobacteria bacterium]
MRQGSWWVLAAGLVGVATGCGAPPPCDEGQVLQGEACVDYVAGEPVDAEVRTVDPGTPWQWQITGTVDTSWDVPVYDVDVFDLTDAVRDTLRDDDRMVICYFSAGSFEPWRDDADQFPEEVIGRPLDGWPDERWLDTRSPVVRSILEARLDEAVAWGCDGVEPDNVTAYHNRSGFPLTATDQLDFNRFLANAAHSRGMGVALKNDVEQVEELVDWFDYSVNEECAAFDECDTLQPFLDAGKPVFHTEYVDDWQDAPDKADEVCGVLPGLSTIIKGWDLGPERLGCPGEG